MNELQACNILVVDPEEHQLGTLRTTLSVAEFRHVQLVGAGDTASLLNSGPDPDVVLVVADSRDAPGWACLEDLQPRLLTLAPARPVILVHRNAASDVKESALALGVTDFLEVPFDAVTATRRLSTVLQSAQAGASRNTSVQESLVESSAAEPAINTPVAVDDAEAATLQRMAAAVEYREDPTGRHPQRVGKLSGLLGRYLGMDAGRVDSLEHAAKLHDIGKVGLADDVLLKAGKLTQEEFEKLKTHTTLGARLLDGTENPVLNLASEIALTHHENWDGSGYPRALSHENIPLSGRIVNVIDVFDAFTNNRPYRKAFSVEMTLEFIRAQRGHEFDPEVVDRFLEMVESEEAQAIIEDRLPTTSSVIERFLDEPLKAATTGRTQP